jgi:hypothetical protein
MTIVNGLILPTSANAAAEQKLLQKLGSLYAHADNLLATYAEAVPGGGKTLRNVLHSVVGSFAIRFTGAIEANAKLPITRRKSLIELADIANDLHLEKLCDELVLATAFPKGGGGWRIISKFGLRHRTAQFVTRAMLSKVVVPQPWQYDFRGFDRAIERIQDAFLTDQSYAIHLDIQNFYGSFNHKTLREELPLPSRMTSNYLVGWKLKYKACGTYPPSHSHVLKEARKGAPQGSSATPMIGVHTISNISWKPAPGTTAAGYVDDFALTASSENEVEASAKALCAAVAALPTGSFFLRSKSNTKPIMHISEGFTFLGVRFSPAPQIKIKVEVTQENVGRFISKLHLLQEEAQEHVIEAKDSNDPRDRQIALGSIARVWRYGKAWLWTFRKCANIVEFKSFPADYIEEPLMWLGSSMDELNEYMADGNEGIEFGYD